MLKTEKLESQVRTEKTKRKALEDDLNFERKHLRTLTDTQLHKDKIRETLLKDMDVRAGYALYLMQGPSVQTVPVLSR